MQIIITFLFFISFSSLAGLDAKYFQNGCSVFGENDTPKSYPGEMCLFLDDGTFVSAGEKGIRRFNRDQTVMWELEGYFHHQINLSEDKKRILALISETTLRGSLRERDDILVVLDIETGKPIYKKNAREILTNGVILPLTFGLTRIIQLTNSDIETSHFNSIYEIPVNERESKAAYLKSGNIIINSAGLGIFILSPDLSQTLYHKIYQDSFNNQIHDVQVTSSGEFILFNNIVYDTTTKNRYSAIDKFDPVANKTTFRYTSETKSFFFSPACGGVQELDGDYMFFSHIVNGGFLYSRKQKKLVQAVPGKNGNIFEIIPTQQIKMIDFKKFLENSRN